MIDINELQLNSIVDRVVEQLACPELAERAPSPIPPKKESPSEKKISTSPNIEISTSETFGSFADSDSAIAAAQRAFLDYKTVPIETRKKIITAIREICLENLEAIAKIALEETGLGRYEDKLVKNKLAITKTPGIEDLESIAWTGDHGLTVVELAAYGVIGAITPCTNPSETIISNTIAMIAGGNAVSFNPHPSAKKTSIFVIALLNKAIISAGGPTNLITTVENPTIQSAQLLMKHPDIALLVVTGGPAVVDAAMKSGKKVIGAGPGNPPVVVDETADIDKAARDIVMSAGTDNNIICLIEKNIIATKEAADDLKKALVKHGAVELASHQAKRLEKIIVDGDHPNKKWVGKDIQLILKEIGMDVDSSKRIAIAEVGPDHPFATIELLLPVIPFIRAKDFDEALEIAYRLEGGCCHTASIHSKNIERLHKMAVKMNTSIFVKNGPALAGLGLGGEGPASFTIASPTGEGVTTARHFVRSRRCVVSGYFKIT